MSPLGRADFSLIDPPKLWTYCAGDADATIRIHKVLNPKLMETGTLYYENTLKPLRVNLTMAELRGMPMSRKLLNSMRFKLEVQLRKLDERMKEIADNDDLNVRSPTQLKKVLYERLKYPILYQTATGHPATAFDVLEKLNKDRPHEFLDCLIEYRKLFKVKSTYLDGFESFMDDNDRVHTSFIVGGTVSGRVSSREPPLATVPRDREYKIGKVTDVLSLRSLFVAPQGYTFLYCDYSQIELRVTAILAGEQKMLDAFAAGEDIHDKTARGIFEHDYVSKEMIEEAIDQHERESLEAKRKQQRNDAKRINFGLLYGAEDKSLADQFGVPREVARKIFDSYYSYYPALAAFLTGIPIIARSEGQLVSPFGKRRVFYYPQDDRGDKKTIGELNRQAVNFLPQSCAAETLFRAMNRMCVRFTELGLDCWPVNIVYDSLIIECKERNLALVKKIMVEELLRPVPELKKYVFPAEVGVGKSWSEAEHGAEKIQ